MVVFAPAMDEALGSCHYLAPQTCSVLDYVRTKLRTVRLAIACGDRSDKALDPSQVAQSTIHLRTEGNERAWKEDIYGGARRSAQ
jgi:hypothetical protein